MVFQLKHITKSSPRDRTAGAAAGPEIPVFPIFDHSISQKINFLCVNQNYTSNIGIKFYWINFDLSRFFFKIAFFVNWKSANPQKRSLLTCNSIVSLNSIDKKMRVSMAYRFSNLPVLTTSMCIIAHRMRMLIRKIPCGP